MHIEILICYIIPSVNKSDHFIEFLPSFSICYTNGGCPFDIIGISRILMCNQYHIFFKKWEEMFQASSVTHPEVKEILMSACTATFAERVKEVINSSTNQYE